MTSAPIVVDLLEKRLERLKRERKSNPAKIGSARWYREIEDQHTMELIRELRALRRQ